MARPWPTHGLDRRVELLLRGVVVRETLPWPPVCVPEPLSDSFELFWGPIPPSTMAAMRTEVIGQQAHSLPLPQGSHSPLEQFRSLANVDALGILLGGHD